MNSNLINNKEKFVYESKVVNINDKDSFYVSKEGYTLVYAWNGDWNAASLVVKGIAHQGTSDLVFLERSFAGNFRVNMLWVKDD